MSLIQWNDTLSVGIETIDRQHQHLIQLINDLHQAMKEGKAKEILGRIIEELSQYAKEHFMNEERLFFKHGYPQQTSHINEHNRFIDQVVDFINSFNSGRATLSLDIMNFLNQWLLNHIRKSDKAYTPFLKGKV
jgi:hemerythrin-like metal-binding protein